MCDSISLQYCCWSVLVEWYSSCLPSSSLRGVYCCNCTIFSLCSWFCASYMYMYMCMHVCLLISGPHLINMLSTYIFNSRQKGHMLLTISTTDESLQTNLDGQHKATVAAQRRLRCPLDTGRWMKTHAKTMLWKSIGKQGILYRHITGLQRGGQEWDESQDGLLGLKVSDLPSANWFMHHGFCSLS